MGELFASFRSEHLLYPLKKEAKLERWEDFRDLESVGLVLPPDPVTEENPSHIRVLL